MVDPNLLSFLLRPWGRKGEIGSAGAEIVITLQDDVEIKRDSDVSYSITKCDILQNEHSNFGEDDTDFNEFETCSAQLLSCGEIYVKSVSVGTYFIYSMTFKQFLRLKAIIEKFGVKLKASDRTWLIVWFTPRLSIEN